MNDWQKIEKHEEAEVWVQLFKPGGKWYTEEPWAIPTKAQIIEAGGMAGDFWSPYAMRWSPDFRTIGGGPVLVPSAEPWGYPHLILGEGV